MTSAVPNAFATSAGKMRSARARTNEASVPRASRLPVTRNPLTTKKMSTPRWPSEKFAKRSSGSPGVAVSGQEWLTSTSPAATSRTRLKLLSRPWARAPTVSVTRATARRAQRGSDVDLFLAGRLVDVVQVFVQRVGAAPRVRVRVERMARVGRAVLRGLGALLVHLGSRVRALVAGQHAGLGAHRA